MNKESMAGFLNLPPKGNQKLEKLIGLIKKHKQAVQLWESCNVMAIQRMRISDHGPVHVSLVANMAVKILRNLISAGVVPSIVKDYNMTNEDAEVVVLLGALFHDIGNSVHRDLHDNVGMVIAYPIMEELLSKTYKDKAQRQFILCEILHAMLAHDTATACYTIEGGCVRIADGLDIKMGRASAGFILGTNDIHAISSMAVTGVVIGYTAEKPIAIEVEMENSAGIFQLDNLLKKKIVGSGLEKYITVKARVNGVAEKKIVENYEMKF